MVDEAAGEDSGLQLLNRCPANALPQLLHEVIDEICGDKDITFNKYENQWNIDEWTTLLIVLKSFIGICAKNDHIPKVNGISQDIHENIEKCISVRSEELHRHLINETCAISETYLKDFDWTVKYVLGSDSMASIKTPLLSLDLELKRVKKSEIVSVEMTKEDLLKLINNLETAYKNMRDLKA
uniref:COMM domain-containing protein n=1 Tax=Strigamia maritima TaxID=126957 RepID=T1JA94_STRMM